MYDGNLKKEYLKYSNEFYSQILRLATYRTPYCRLADCYDGAKAIRMRRTKKDKNVKNLVYTRGLMTFRAQ